MGLRLLFLLLFCLLFSACTVHLPTGEALVLLPIDEPGMAQGQTIPAPADAALKNAAQDVSEIDMYYQGMMLGCLRGGLDTAQTLGLGRSALIQRRVQTACRQVIVRAYELGFHTRSIEGWPGIEELKND